MYKVLALVFATLTMALLCSAPAESAQVSINIGVAPVCPYGYFSYAPLRLLRARLVCRRRVYWSWPLVPRPGPLLRPCR